MEWYLSRDGQVWGPIHLDQMKKALAERTALPTDLVWRSGMAGWMPASDVAELRARPAPRPKPPIASPPAGRKSPIEPAGGDRQPAVAKPVASTAARPAQPSNFISRHWRGEFSLATAHWVFGVLLTALALAGLYFLADSRVLQHLGQQAMGSYSIAVACFILMFSAWQIVGVWRSARRHVQSGKRRNWAGLAKISVLFGALQLAVGSYSILAPLTVEQVKASIDTPSAQPQHPIRLAAGGGEVQIGGELGYGAHYELARLFAASSRIKRIRIDGGTRFAEPDEIAKLLMRNSVATFARGDCIGGCAIVFMAGSSRYMDKKGRLGFYGTQPGADSQEQYRSAMLQAALRSHGLPPPFVKKALSHTVDDVWYPTAAELTSAGVILTTVDPPERDGLSAQASTGTRR